MSQYPGGLDAIPTNKVDDTPTHIDHPGHHNLLADAINKLETELGTNPKGSHPDVRRRLESADALTAAIFPDGANYGSNSDAANGFWAREGGTLVWKHETAFASSTHEATHTTGGSDAFLNTDIIEAIVKRLQEASGPTTLAMGAIADGRALKRSGGSIVGVDISTLPAAKYRIVSDGATVTAYNTSGTVVSSSNDFGAVLTAVLPANNSFGYRIDIRNDGNIFPTRTIPAMPRGLLSKLYVCGNGATVQAQISAGRRFSDLPYVDDYDNYQMIEFWDITFDRNNIVSTSSEHVFCGNLFGSWTRRGNYKGFAFRRCKTINVPIRGTGNTHSISIVSGHLASGEPTQTVVTNIVQEDCDWGGDYGYDFMGSLASGGSVTAGLGVNVYLDEIHTVRGSCDTGTTPTSFYGSGSQVGGYGYCGKVRVRDWTAKNSGDVGLEIDNCQDFVGTACTGIDCWNVKFMSRNFRLPANVDSQKNTWRDCYSYNTSLSRVSNYSSDFALNGDSTTAGYFFGEFVLENPTCSDTISPSHFATGGFATFNGEGNNGVQVRKVTVKNVRFSFEALAPNAAVTQYCIGIRAVNTGAIIDVDGVYGRWVGTRSGVGAISWFPLRLNTTDGVINFKNIAYDLSNYTGATTASDTFYCAVIGSIFTTTAVINVDNVGMPIAPGSSPAIQGIYLGSLLTVRGQAYISRLDMARATSNVGFDVAFVGAVKPQVTIFNTISSRAGAQGVATGPVTQTGTFTMNYPQHEGVFANASGAMTVTLPDATAVPVGKQFWIKRINTSSNLVTIATQAGQTIDGSATYVLSSPYQAITVVSNGTNWEII